MNIAIIGATGQVGSRIVSEALQRGHVLTALARRADTLEARDRLNPISIDFAEKDALIAVLRGHDAVVSATRFISTPLPALHEPIKASGVKRWLIVGGAGSLEVAPGQALVDTPGFPQAYRAEAAAGRDFLNNLRRETELEWTFLSPSAVLAPGKRTGQFRLGRDQLLTGPDGSSSISIEDFAVALVDELEKPRHLQQRFTVGY